MGSFREAEAHAHKSTNFVKVIGNRVHVAWVLYLCFKRKYWRRPLPTIPLMPQTKEEGKSLLQEIAKLKAVQESSGKQVAADLAMIDIDHEFSPIAATGTTS